MIDHPDWDELRAKFGDRLACDVPLKDHSTFGVGGPARVMIRPETDEELAEIILICNRLGLRYYILGAGSNILFLDSGYDGVIIKLGRSFRAMEYLGDGVISAGAAVPVGQLLEMALDLELSGLECLAGIPGTLGGALWMNAGSFGTSIGTSVWRIHHVDPQGRKESILGEFLDFSYRSLKGLPPGAVMVGAELKLKPGQGPAMREAVRAMLEQRAERHPRGVRCAGSIFKNPPGMPAGRIIEECGFKGASVGGALVSQMHANFIVNPEGQADSSDILELMHKIMDGVRQANGLILEPEIKIIGPQGEVKLNGQI